jgi:hypothetical protein
MKRVPMALTPELVLKLEPSDYRMRDDELAVNLTRDGLVSAR